MKRVFRKGKEFKIIPENRTVIGKQDKQEVYKDLDEATKKVGSIISYVEDLIYGWDYVEPVVATAYCDPQDEFDEERGLNVCEEKLDFKQHIQLAKRYSSIYRLLMETANYVYKKCKAHLDKAKAINADLEKTYGRLPL